MNPTIIFILHLPPPVHGASMVGKYIHDSSVINDAFDCHYINLTTARDLSDIGRIGLRKLRQFVELLQHIHKEVKRLRPEFVYVTPNACGGAFYKDFIVVQMLKCMGCKVVVHYHNKGVATRQDKWFDDKLYRIFFKGIKVILLAEALYHDVRKYVRRDDVFVCPNGIPDTSNSEIKAGCNNKILHLLFLSNLLESKGVLVLLDALRILREKGLSLVCDFVGGETSEIDNMRFEEEVHKYGLEGYVDFHGKKYGKEKDVFFQKTDVFVFPTFYDNECFPLVLLEAMQFGIPCISTKEGGIPSIIDDGCTGWLVKRQSSEDLAERLEWMINNPEESQAMGKKGRNKFEKEFTLSKFEMCITDILQRLIS